MFFKHPKPTWKICKSTTTLSTLGNHVSSAQSHSTRASPIKNQDLNEMTRYPTEPFEQLSPYHLFIIKRNLFFNLGISPTLEQSKDYYNQQIEKLKTHPN